MTVQGLTPSVRSGAYPGRFLIEVQRKAEISSDNVAGSLALRYPDNTGDYRVPCPRSRLWSGVFLCGIVFLRKEGARLLLAFQRHGIGAEQLLDAAHELGCRLHHKLATPQPLRVIEFGRVHIEEQRAIAAMLIA